MQSCWPWLAILALGGGCLVGDEGSEDDFDADLAGSAPVRIVQHNIEKKRVVLDRAIAAAQQDHALGITLEEVCPADVAYLQQTFGSRWTIATVPQKRVPSTGCDQPDGTHAIPYVVAIWTGGTDGKVTPYSALGAPAAAPGEMVCVQFDHKKVPTHLCAAHLISAKWTDPATGTTYAGDDVRDNQTRAVKQIASDWFAGTKNHFGIVAGDFNGQPDTPPLDHLYAPALGGGGDFTDYNRNGDGRDGTDTAHADGTNTDDGLPYAKQIDYVFFSVNRAPLAGAKPTITKDQSDHDMVEAVAQMRK